VGNYCSKSDILGWLSDGNLFDRHIVPHQWAVRNFVQKNSIAIIPSDI